MQSNPNPNDPNYMPPIEQIPPAAPPYQQGQPGYQNQPGVPPYQSQPGVPYTTPPNQYRAPQYMAPPTPYAQSTTQQKKRARNYGVAKVMDYLQWVLLALELLFLLRFVLQLIGADPTNQFAATLYAFTGFFLAPFEGIVPSTTLGSNGNAVIEWSTLVGMAVYALLFYLVRYLLRITISRPREPLE
jgi:YGGT family protein